MILMRAVAVLIALAGVIDPVVAVTRRQPLPIEIRLPDSDSSDFSEATRLRDELIGLTGPSVNPGRGERPLAVVAIGNAAVDPDLRAPLFAVALTPRDPAVRLLEASVVVANRGQQVQVRATARAPGARGRSSEFVLSSGDARLGRLEHTWSRDDETFEIGFTYLPASVGISRLRVSAITEGATQAAVDVPVVVQDRRLRVLVFEPRPAWAATFIRQALEGHAVFQPSGLARTSRGIATHTAGVPAALTSAALDEVDAVVVTGLEALSRADQEELQRFVGIRGGTLILAPDGRIPEHVRDAFALPALEEVLLERSIEVELEQSKVRASELLLAPAGQSMIRAIATIEQGSSRRTTAFAVSRGRGQVVVWGALDAWRFRSSGPAGFARAWQALAADAAMAAAPRIGVEIDPPLVRPGDDVSVRVTVRETEWTRGAAGVELPPVSATLIPASGLPIDLRLWPAATPGSYAGRFAAPRAGDYLVRVTSGQVSADARFEVNAAAVLPQRDRTRALQLLAEISGGGVVGQSELPSVAEKLRSIERPNAKETVHPMRTAWWIVPFTALLGGEWIARRRRGLR